MTRECPHCHVHVIPSRTGVCPSCNKNVNDLASATLHLTMRNFFPREILPPYCYLCDTPATGRVKVRCSQVHGDGMHPVVAALWFLFSLAGGIIRIFSLGDRHVHSITIRLPRCQSCAAVHPKTPLPEFVDFERGHMTFLVHKNFADRLAGPTTPR